MSSSTDLVVPPEIQEAIKDITNDHDSGARQLALKALSALKLATTLFPADPSSWPNIVNCAWHISQSRPPMKPAIETAILRALNRIQPTYPSPTITTLIDTLITEESQTLDRISTHFRRLITINEPEKILTLSNSSTIFHVLKSLFDWYECPDLVLTILESRPLFEGVTLAQKLLPFKPPHVQIQIAADATAAHFANEADMVLIGADQVDPFTGDVKNKVGSFAAARFSEMCVCVTSTDKLAPEDKRKEWEELNEREKEEEEWAVWGQDMNDTREMTGAGPGVVGGEKWVVRNMYFEWVGASDIEGYLTEEGFQLDDWLEEIYLERESWKKVWKVIGRDTPIGEKKERSSTGDSLKGNKRTQKDTNKGR